MSVCWKSPTAPAGPYRRADVVFHTGHTGRPAISRVSTGSYGMNCGSGGVCYTLGGEGARGTLPDSSAQCAGLLTTRTGDHRSALDPTPEKQAKRNLRNGLPS